MVSRTCQNSINTRLTPTKRKPSRKGASLLLLQLSSPLDPVPPGLHSTPSVESAHASKGRRSISTALHVSSSRGRDDSHDDLWYTNFFLISLSRFLLDFVAFLPSRCTPHYLSSHPCAGLHLLHPLFAHCIFLVSDRTYLPILHHRFCSSSIHCIATSVVLHLRF